MLALYHYLANWQWLALIGLFSLLVGSFLNVVIYRLPLMQQRDWAQDARETLLELEQLTIPTQRNYHIFTLSLPGSACPHCGHRIRWYENIPVLSYLALRGRCSSCQQPISLRYPLIELLTATLSVWVASQTSWGWPLAFGLVFTWLLIAMSFIDLDHYLLLDSLTYPLLWLGLLLSVLGGSVSPTSAIVGALLGYLSLWSLCVIFKWLTGKDGMGGGDFKLLAALGAWLGASQLPLVVLLSSVSGLLIVALASLVQGRLVRQIPFGPSLALAGFICWLYGERLLSAYLSFSGLKS